MICSGGACSSKQLVHNSEFKPKKVEPKRRYNNVITLLFLEHYQPLLHELNYGALESIQNEFYDGRSTVELDNMRALISSAPTDTNLAIFFFMLNVDQGLKTRITEMENPDNHPKLVRFLLDLKRILVLQFFTDEKQQVSEFVLRCEEFYVLA